MKVYLDDERPTPEGWHRVYTAQEAIAALEAGGVETISLDHDLGPPSAGTGYDVGLLDRARSARGQAGKGGGAVPQR